MKINEGIIKAWLLLSYSWYSSQLSSVFDRNIVFVTQVTDNPSSLVKTKDQNSILKHSTKLLIQSLFLFHTNDSIATNSIQIQPFYATTATVL